MFLSDCASSLVIAGVGIARAITKGLASASLFHASGWWLERFSGCAAGTGLGSPIGDWSSIARSGNRKSALAGKLNRHRGSRAAQSLAQGQQPLGGCRNEVLSVLTVDDEGGGPAPVQFADSQLDLGELFVFRINRGELE